MRLEGNARMLRVHFGEDDRFEGAPLYEAIIHACRELDIAGATVYRGIEGFGASTRIHRAHFWSLSSDAPIMVTVIDSEDKIRTLLPVLDRMVTEGMIAISNVEVIKYTHQPRHQGGSGER
jgi:PII-like signaling protein